MRAPEYPTFTSEKELPPLTFIQQVALFVEGSPIFATTALLWFLGVSCTLVLPYIEGTPRTVVLVACAAFFGVSIIVFGLLLKAQHLEKPHYNAERHFLRRMGVVRPRRFLREHPLHLAAYNELEKEIGDAGNTRYSRDGLKMVLLPALLVFTGADGYKMGPLILSIINDRHITDATSIAAILKEAEDNPPVLNEGAL